jgi:hypothetical protein
MQIDMDSDIKYFIKDDTLSYFKYKSGDYIPDDELYKLFSYVYGRVHSTSGNFYILELSMGNKNKNNKRFAITDKLYFTIVEDSEKIKGYTCCDIHRPRFTFDDH